ncbi:MAG: hypothetical protein ABI045_04085 [Flavobacteriales bacterium]
MEHFFGNYTCIEKGIAKIEGFDHSKILSCDYHPAPGKNEDTSTEVFDQAHLMVLSI